jgi:O-antigen ligase
MSKNMSLLKVLIVLLLFFFPFGELIRFNVGINIILKPVDIISALIFLWVVIYYIKEKKFRKSLKWYYFFFSIVGIVSLIINSYWLKPNELLTAFLYLLRWIIYMSIFFAVIHLDQQFRKKIVKFLFIDGIVVVLIGYIQFFMYPDLKNLYYLGWDDHMYRLFSSFFDPNFVGAFFVLYLIFVAGFLFAKVKHSKKFFWINITVAIATLIATFLTYSRSAILMLITSGVTFFIYVGKKKFIIYLLLIIGVFMVLASPYFYLENINPFRKYSSFQRLSDISKGLTIFKDHPIVGVGFDSYRYAQYRYHYECGNCTQNPVHNAAGTDNSIVFVLATTGLIGFAAYFNLWYQLIKKAWKIKNRFSIIFITSTVGLFINSLFNNSLFYTEIMIWMWFITSFLFEKN